MILTLTQHSHVLSVLSGMLSGIYSDILSGWWSLAPSAPSTASGEATRGKEGGRSELHLWKKKNLETDLAGGGKMIMQLDHDGPAR